LETIGQGTLERLNGFGGEEEKSEEAKREWSSAGCNVIQFVE
jgi:hypothetical protein